MAEMVTYQGPMPPPSQLREYDHVVPGTAAAIVELFKGEAPHRREMDRSDRKTQRIAILGAVIDQLVGTVVAGLLGVGSLGIAAYGVLHDKPAAIGAVLVPLAQIIASISQRKSTRESK